MEPQNTQDAVELTLEAILVNQDKNSKSQESVLEAILVNQDSNAKSVEPILEASLVKQDEIVKELKKPMGLSIEINGAETTMYKGDKGDPGNIFDELTKEQKLSIKGDKGDKGDKGEKGDTGEQGPVGPKGESIKGEKGERGVAGRSGKDGKNGLDGLDGIDGRDGKDGKDGKSIDPKDVKKIAKELNKNNNLFLNIPGVKHVHAGTNITLTGTDEDPIINATGGGGTGDVVGPASAVDSNFASFNTTTGKLIKDSGVSTASFAPALGSDDNYVTDAEKVVIGNTSGTNSGDNAVNSNYSGLVTNATHTGDATGSGALTVVALNGTNLAALGTGVLKNTTTTGVPFISKVALTEPATAATLTIANNQTLTVNGSATITNGTHSGTNTGDNTVATALTGTPSITVATVTTTGNIELGHASDTTISRSAAGVLAVEGVVIPSISSTNTITNKRNQVRTASSTTSSNLSPDLSTANVYFRTTQTATLTIDAPTGTPVIGEVITLYVDSAGAQTLTINATYKAFGAAFPAATTAGKTFMMTAMYNGTDWKTTWSNAV